MNKTKPNWEICTDCQGLGQQKRHIKNNILIAYEAKLRAFETSNGDGEKPTPPVETFNICSNCSGSGLIAAENFPIPDENFPHVAIIGAGIGGIALAIGCLHRGIPFTIFEKDRSFNERSQGYGLTLQQARKTLENFGIFNLESGIVSNHHVVHTPDGKIVGQWGMRKWLGTVEKFTTPNNIKRSNIHIARQSLRQELLNQLGGDSTIKWGHQLINFKENLDREIELKFEVEGKIKTKKADLIVGADGIRSVVRNQLIGEEISPLRYLGCIVILGICPLEDLKTLNSELLDSATVFQTANGNERIYMMPFDKDSVMWQLSFPLSEDDAKELSLKGKTALKEEAIRRTQWHSPIPEILAATHEAQISGYPVYDRALLSTELLENSGLATLIGDAAHPMSPFKGQGANQALLDALFLVREIFKNGKLLSTCQETGLRESVLKNFEKEMIERTATKVKDSAAAAQFLHSKVALYKGNEPRGRALKRGDIKIDQ